MSNPSDAVAGMPASLIEVWRGPLVESRHRGHLTAVTGGGNTIASLGLPETVTYVRSSGKPFQAIPVIVSGAADRFGFTEQEIAIACGVHEPFSAEVARELARNQQSPNVLQNNCSGKHAAMLALAVHIGAATESYEDWRNPVQQMISETFADFSGVPLQQIAVGVDGCGVPVFGVPVRAMALMYARLVAPESFDAATRDACQRITKAMIAFPEMVGGTKDRLDTELIKAGQGRLISKIGAEGVYTVGVLPSAAWPHGLGLALKIEDGDDHRARPPAVIEALGQLNVLAESELMALASYAPTIIKNRRGERVGEARASFTLAINRVG